MTTEQKTPEVRMTIEGHICVISLDNAAKKNAINERMWDELLAAFREIDERTERVELFEDARLTRDRDEVRGNQISLDQRAESFSVTSGAQTSEGRVRAVIQPKAPPPAK